ncbi:hypothetical protein [Paludibaculum fermentans]|uniref:hypothetical protein n=1 Tax=Paludibaculum fermentans TaxID=1473598 RepID=UPI003EB8F08F
MHRLASSFVLGYHGCDRQVGESLLKGAPFEPSNNEYDWLGPGIYFWEANPRRGLEFAHESSKRKLSSINEPFVVGAVVELGLCLDLTTSSGVDWMRIAYKSLVEVSLAAGVPLSANSSDQLRRNLDCAVVRRLHSILADRRLPAPDTIKGVFTEGGPAYPGAGFLEKTHIQIAVCNQSCIKGVFRVPVDQSRP